MYLWLLKSWKYIHLFPSRYEITSLNVPIPIPDEEKKLTYIFIFKLLCDVPKDALQVFIKPFEASQRSVR